ncbi:hypothetical protein [Nevskia sp.]|uniref:hypothetical protein n=1 Tax=Nevskia sp. TaxID=1929292 RepID=UPI0025F7D29A|nr:hypothetical protein [Nevskia sp.]
MHATDSPRPSAATLLSLAASSAALLSPTAGAAPGDPIGPPIVVANSAANEQVARAGNGRMVASYLKSGALTAKRYAANGTPLGAPITVTTFPGRGSSGGAAMDADGDFVVAWFNEEQRRTLIRAQRYAADGSALGPVIEVASVLTPDSAVGTLVDINQGVSRLSVDMNADGDFAVMFSDFQRSLVGNRFACKYLIGAVCFGDARETLRLRRYDASGAPLGPLSQVATVSEPNVEIGRLGFLSAGRLLTGTDIEMRTDGSTLAAWSTFGGVRALSRGRVYTRNYNVDGSAQPAREVGVATDAYRAGVQFDSSADGSYVLVHSSEAADASDRAIELDLLASDGSPIRPRTRADAQSNNFRTSPAVCMDAAGNHVVAFREVGSIVARRYATGGTALSGQFEVTGPSVSGSNPALACDAVGNFVIGYTRSNRDFVLQLHEGP